MLDSLWPHGLQHARLPCPSPNPRACSNSCPSSWWCHPTISSSVVPFSSCLQSFPASGAFPVSQFFASGSQNIGASVSALVLFSIRSRESHLASFLWRNKPLIFYLGKSLFPTKHEFVLPCGPKCQIATSTPTPAHPSIDLLQKFLAEAGNIQSSRAGWSCHEAVRAN